ncbi:glycosyltransferase family A protein [Actinomyces sp. MRS3W]|uniref:glycosyltransferase family 2 protein n=1 Tax=Actinomyces sp. MRS3W TaxID=2800796 RepID=UPI0028FD835F|nr:glycosyltransferase family A protein [Actinomyces sp. MRS3W]MDU0348249.1 glycosyltransferase family A protein [Actinomyces sp. MRS3W]
MERPEQRRDAASECPGVSPGTSVIIPCHNVSQEIGLQLEALARQKGARPFEVLLVDNRSTDDLTAAAEPWRDRLDIRVLPAPSHTGASYARNVGIGAARGSKLLFCDGDDLVGEHFVALGQRALDDVPLYCTGFVAVNERVFAEGREAVRAAVPEETEYRRPTAERQDPRWPILPGCCFGARAELLAELGGFDRSLEPGAEDNDLGLRALDAGLLPPILDSTTLAYRIRDVGRRPLSLYRRRAVSISLLLTRRDAWRTSGAISGHPYAVLLRSLLAVWRVLARPGATTRGEWLMRVVTALGFCEGWTRYRLLRRRVPSELGIGLDEGRRLRRR